MYNNFYTEFNELYIYIYIRMCNARMLKNNVTYFSCSLATVFDYHILSSLINSNPFSDCKKYRNVFRIMNYRTYMLLEDSNNLKIN